ncbi:MAG: metallophosphoesterase, partial [Pseudomonadota bacterium]
PLEYALGLRFLLELGSASEVAVVPGNHDIYTRLLTDPGVGRWQAFMTGDRAWDAFDAEQRLGPTFPYVRQIGQVAVIGVNTAVPTPPGSAYGRVGARQLTDLRRVLGRAGEQGLFRLILMHHPPRPDQALPSRGLRDGLQFMEVIAEFGAEAILHGHNHRPMQNTATTPGGTCPIYGVPSASVETAVSDWGLASYHALTITGDGPGSWKIVCARYSLAVDPDTDEPVVSLSETWSAEPGHAGLSDPVCAQS